MNEIINSIFVLCVFVIEQIGLITGLGYQLTNIVLFVILQPLLILIFFYLWIREKKILKYVLMEFKLPPYNEK
tara:strand:+ start:1168 stop:1386 length:219 start_codon:yes stop_codon:yes gene_type:complete